VIRQFVLVQIVDGLEVLHVSQNLAIRGNHDEHTVIFAPETGFLKVVAECGLGHNAAREVVAAIVDVEVVGIELIDVRIAHCSQDDVVTG